MNPLRQRDTRIPRRPLLWLAAALLFTLPPMFGALALWVPLLFLVTLAAKFWMEPRGYRFRSVVGKLVFTAAMLVTTVATYGSIKGIEPGISIVAAMMSLKILEAHTAREFHVMVMFAWMLCACGFFLSQDLAIAVCLATAFILLLVALIQFHGGSSNLLWPAVRTTGRLLTQALPLVALLFVFFPRIQTGFRFQLGQSGAAATGFSGRLSPGSVTSLANSSHVAFRVEFPDGKIPPPSALYWRGVVMRQGDGLEWRAPVTAAALPRSVSQPTVGKTIRQLITIEPHGEHWMFALDVPLQSPSGAIFAPGNYLWSYQPIRKSRRYEVRSSPEIPDKELRPRERKMLLEVPAVSPTVQKLVESWRAADPDPRAIVRSALRFFGNDFRYSIAPGGYKGNDLDEFLFRRRIGFCEHYAASFATLMRLGGIPARVVVGYLGGEYNEFGRFFLVRQSDAHAWCEIWLPESGWQRVDPTSVVAPERVNLGFDSFMQRRASSGRDDTDGRQLGRNFARRPIFHDLRLAWDSLNYAWDTRVLSFDSEAQQSFAANIGIPQSGPLSFFVYSLVIASLLLAIYAAWIRLRARPRVDRVKALYKKFCNSLARFGIARHSWEGPLNYSQRAEQLLPKESNSIRQISNTYIALRYSPDPTKSLLDAFANEVKVFIRETH
jgi:protein-glutamine gamma-glutamyltransferase